MPESPRWLITQNRRQDAEKIIREYYEPVRDSVVKTDNFPEHCEVREKSGEVPELNGTTENEGFLRSNLKSLRILYSHVELRKRAFIMYFSWMTSSLCYYVIGKQAHVPILLVWKNMYIIRCYFIRL